MARALTRLAALAATACSGGPVSEFEGRQLDFTAATLIRAPGPDDDQIEATIVGESWCVLARGHADAEVDVFAVVVLVSPPRSPPPPPFGRLQAWLFEGNCPEELDPSRARAQLTSGGVTVTGDDLQVEAAIGRVRDGALTGQIFQDVPLSSD